MFAEPDLMLALERIAPRTVRGFCSRFVEFRHLSATGQRIPSGNRPLWGLGSKLFGGRFTPKGSFEAVYLAEDPVTALAEVTGVLYHPPIKVTLSPQPPWVLITVEAVLHRVLDLTAAGIQRSLGTDAQELTVPWRHLQAAAQEAPTQTLGRICHQSGRFEAIRYPSSKNPEHGVCLAVFTDRLGPPSSLRVFDPHGRLAQQLP